MSKLKVNLVVYLAGGISGLTEEEAFSWRSEAVGKLEPCGIKCYNPIAVGDFERFNDGDGHFSGGDKICYHRDKFMVNKSDIILINYDTFQKVTSIGTSVEKGWADGSKLIIVFSKQEIEHPFITENAIIVNTLAQAIELIKGLQ
jgi:hypothetical protein